MPCDETGLLCEYNWSLHGDEIHLLFLLELYLILAWFQSLMPDIPYTGLSSRLDINSGSRERSWRLPKNRDSEIELYRLKPIKIHHAELHLFPLWCNG